MLQAIRVRLALAATFLLTAGSVALGERLQKIEILRDTWGTPHIFAASEAAGFFGVGYAAAEDRILQMDLFRRRATGRLAEVFGDRWLESDRRFRIAGMAQHCSEAIAALPEDVRAVFRGYAAGVNAYLAQNPQKVGRRFRPLGVLPEPWTPADSVCAWMAVGEIFDRFIDEGAVQSYHEFRQLAAELGEEEALQRRGMMIDDAAAVVPESEMAKNAAVYARLKSLPRTPGYWMRSLPDDMLRFSHAWAVSGRRSVTGAPILESDPQTSVNNPPLWWEFHLSAGRYDVRGISVAGSPGMLIGFNRRIAWGATALGAGSGVTFIEKRTADRNGYEYRGSFEPFRRRTEIIQVKGGPAVSQEVLRTRHGFVIDSLIQTSRPGETYVSHYPPIETNGTSLLGMLKMMRASNWAEFREGMAWYFSPGLHVVYADTAGNLGYQTLVHVPLTKRSRRMALEGWTGNDEVTARIPLDEMPHMLNPDGGFISHANNLPVGSWYPYDLGIGTGGTGHSARSLRLADLLSAGGIHSVETFESNLHRDDVDSQIAALLPVARRLAEETASDDRAVANLLAAVRDWNFRFQASQSTYTAGKVLAGNLLPPYRRSSLTNRLGGGDGGIAHLARRLREQYGRVGIPSDPDVRDYLLAWLRAAAAQYQQTAGRGSVVEIHRMPYQANGPLQFPALDPAFELVSPPLSCAQGSTIWSQHGNSYTQIVDLADIDNSRTILPPGISEDPESRFHANQMELWAAGGTHPAPLSRAKVEALTVSRIELKVDLRFEAATQSRTSTGARGN